MMISPMEFYERYIDGKSIDEVRKIINKLRKENRDLIKILEDPRLIVSPICAPHPKTKISMNLEYINEARNYIFEKNGELYMNKKEENAFIFSQSIEHIDTISLLITSFSSPKEPIIIKFVGDMVVSVPRWYLEEFEYEISKFNEFDISEKERITILSQNEYITVLHTTKQVFLRSFDELNIGAWDKTYSTLKYDMEILDGTQWELTITYKSGKVAKYGGSNAYPYNFDDLCQLFGIDNSDEEE